MSKIITRVRSGSWFFFSFAMFGLLFFLPRLPEIERNGIQIFDEFLILFSCVVIYISFSKTSWLWKFLSLFLTMCIFYLPLLRIWGNVVSNFNTVLGILPWSDASNYYMDALELLHGGLFGTFSGYRPLFGCLLTVLLAITQQNLQIVLIIFVIINAIAAFLLAKELSNIFGPLVGIITLFLLQIYYRQFAGSTMSEQLGMAAGEIAFLTLVIAFRAKDFRYFCVGLFFSVFAMFVRPGALFIIPTIILLGLFTFSEDRQRMFRNAILIIIIVLATWQLNLKVSQFSSGPNSMPLGIFSYTLYGQAKGGAGWQQFFIDYPNQESKSSADLPTAAYNAALAEIYNHPIGLMKGILKSYRDFIFPGLNSVFGYIRFGNDIFDQILQISFLILMVIGLTKCWLERSSLVCALMLAFAVGIFLSIPFVPPGDATGMRLYAVTIVIPCLFAAFGLGVIAKKPILLPSQKNMLLTNGTSAVLFGSLMIVMSLSVVLIKANNRKPVFQAITCPEGLVPVAFYAPTGSYLMIVKNEIRQTTDFPIVPDKDVRRSLKNFPGDYTIFINDLRHAIAPPTIFTSTINFAKNEDVWLLAPPEILGVSGKIIRACGSYTDLSRKIIQITTFE